MFFGLIKTFDEKVHNVITVVDSGRSAVIKYPFTAPRNLAYMLEALDRYGEKVAKHFMHLYVTEKIEEILESR